MLSAKLLRRIRLQRDQSGAALVTVVALVAITSIVCLGVSSSVFASNGITTLTRAGVQSKAAADSGINWALGQMSAGAYPCSSDQSTSDPAFKVSISYTTSASTALTCSGTVVSGTPAFATIDSIGYAQLNGSRQTFGNSFEEGAKATITIASTAATLDQAIFAESGLTMTNGDSIKQSASGALDGDIYTNGSWACQTSGPVIQGSVYAHGSASDTNTCQVQENLWTGGNFDGGQSNYVVKGNLTSAGTVSVGVGQISGSVLANGNVTLDNNSGTSCASGTATVCGSVYSLNGSITFGQNGPIVRGSAYAHGNIALNGNNTVLYGDAVSTNGAYSSGQNGGYAGGNVKVYGNVSGRAQDITKAKTCSLTVTSSSWGKCAASDLALPLPSAANPAFTASGMFSPATATNLGTSTSTVSVVAPPRQSFPQISSSSSSLTANWADWSKPALPSAMCSDSNNQSWTTAFNTLMASYGAGSKVLLNFGSCAGKTSALSLNGDTLKINGDIALMLPYGLSSSNGLSIQSADGAAHNVLLIVPSDAPGITWNEPDHTNYPGQLTPTCSAGRNLTFNSISVANGNKTLLYTPCQLSIANTTSVTGQMYSGSLSIPSNFTITRSTLSVPGLTIPGSGSSGSSTNTAVITSRYDIG